MKTTTPTALLITIVSILGSLSPLYAQEEKIQLKVEQLTFGKKHHFFGYIGHCLTVPWNQSERYILTLQVEHIDRMPLPEEAATIAVIDTKDKNKVIYYKFRALEL